MKLFDRAAGETKPAGRRQGLQPRRDIDAVAVERAVLDDDVADIDADAQLQPPPGRHGRVLARQPLLDRKGGLDGGDDAGELHQQAVAGGVDQPAVAPGDCARDAARQAFSRLSAAASSAPISRL